MIESHSTKRILRKLSHILIIIICVLLYGTLGYMVIEKWNFLDSFYMTAITFTTVGFGEVSELGSQGRIFTLTLLLAGVATFGYGISSLTGIIVEGQIKNVFRIKKMEKSIKALSNHIILCGYGGLGKETLKEIEKWKHPYVIIDHSDDIFEKTLDDSKLIIHGDATDDKILIQAGIKKAKGLIACLANDADNLFLTLTAKGLNPDLRIVAKTVHYSSEAKLLHAGADKVISPKQIGGIRMASIIINPDVINFLDVVINEKDYDFSIQAVRVYSGSALDSVTLKESIIPTTIKVIGLKKGGVKMITNPASDITMNSDDILIVLGETLEIAKLYKIAENKK